MKAKLVPTLDHPASGEAAARSVTFGVCLAAVPAGGIGSTMYRKTEIEGEAAAANSKQQAAGAKSLKLSSRSVSSGKPRASAGAEG